MRSWVKAAQDWGWSLRDMNSQWEYEHRWDRLATYNSEVGRGIVHTSEYDAQMREEQRKFDEEQRPRPRLPAPNKPTSKEAPLR